ncbi:18639_t:CDS:2, partial [Funneliformis geosporum]
MTLYYLKHKESDDSLTQKTVIDTKLLALSYQAFLLNIKFRKTASHDNAFFESSILKVIEFEALLIRYAKDDFCWTPYCS